MNSIAVSVCVPVYNVESTLEKCLDSLTKQSLKNIEIICVNDGSTDKSGDILAKYANSDSRIRIINKDNGGLPSARNVAISAAKGKYIGFVDSDDYVEVDMFKVLYTTAKRKSADIVICGANIYPEEPRANEWYYHTLSPRKREYNNYDPCILFEDSDVTPFLWRTLIKNSIIKDNNLKLDEEVVLGEDRAFQIKCIKKANRISVLPNKLYNYYWCREGSLMDLNKGMIDSNFAQKHCKMLLSIMRDCEFSQKESVYFFTWCIPFLYNDFIYISLYNKQKLAMDMVAAWKRLGYRRVEYELSDLVRKEYKYFYKISISEEVSKPLVSIVVIVENEDETIEDILFSVTKQRNISYEVIIVNNGISTEEYKKIERIICKDCRVRVYNTPEHYSFSKQVKAGVQLSEGEYTHIIIRNGKYTDDDSLFVWYQRAKTNKLDICDGLMPGMCKEYKRVFLNDYSLEKNLFKTDFLKNNIDHMVDASIVTGSLFDYEVSKKTKNVGEMDKDCYVPSVMWRKDWISTDKCLCILKAIRKKEEASIKNNDLKHIEFLLNQLDMEPLKQMIVNGTRIYTMPGINSSEGSQSDIINELYTIYSIVPYDLMKKKQYSVKDDLLKRVILERLEYINEM